VESYKGSYASATNKYEQTEIAAKVVHLWRQQTPIGRFLKPMAVIPADDPPTNNFGEPTLPNNHNSNSHRNHDNSNNQQHQQRRLYQDIGDKQARLRTAQMLREKRTDALLTLVTRPAVVTPTTGEEDMELQDNSSGSESRSPPSSSSMSNNVDRSRFAN
jgi:hypothetical protein